MQDTKQGFVFRALGTVERVGNNMLNPMSIFAVLCLIVLVLSALCSAFGVTAIHPKDGKLIEVVNLLSVAGLRDWLGSMVRTFQNFPPVGMVLFIMVGIGVAEKTGLMSTALRASIVNLPKGMITVAILLLGIIANAASDAGFVVLPPLAAVVYMSVGRHPFIGVFAAFAGVAGGFSANVMVTMTDVLAASFTVPAAQLVDPSFTASPAMNYYFLCASTFVLVGVGYFVTERIIAPRFEGVEYTRPDADSALTEITDVERRGLRLAGISLLLTMAVIAALCIGDMPFFGDPKTGSLLAASAPLMTGIVPVITLLFLIPGLVYGVAVKRIKRDTDAVVMMGKSMGEMGPFIVLVVVMSQFVTLFGKSNLGIILAIKGAGVLSSIGLTGNLLLVGFVTLTAFINLFIGSASVKWGLLAPIFVPMFMLLDNPIDPALTQMAYRIGDSVTNVICPVFAFFPIILGHMQKYDKNAGMGTIFANMLPYSFCFYVSWCLFLVIYVSLGLPLGF